MDLHVVGKMPQRNECLRGRLFFCFVANIGRFMYVARRRCVFFCGGGGVGEGLLWVFGG